MPVTHHSVYKRHSLKSLIFCNARCIYTILKGGDPMYNGERGQIQ